MRELKKILIGLALLIVLGGSMFYAWELHLRNKLHFETPYQGVLLDNGQFLYGKLEQVTSDFPILTDVYYVQQTMDPQTKEVKSVLVRRGGEWHAPPRTFLNMRHVVMIEPVGHGSKVEQLISELKAKER